ncbi:MAG: AAA family ATPase [Phycisphaerales bacterium]|nr:AAA family ATPase [Phycisphaerales bacterium]
MGQSNAERLMEALRSRSPCVWIVTDEEEDALALVAEAAMSLSWEVRRWSVTTGVVDGLIAGGRPAEGTINAGAALAHVGAEAGARPGPVIAVFLDLLGLLGDEVVLRATRDVVQQFERSGAGRLVLIDHRDSLPAVLRSSVVRFEIGPPDAEEIRRIVTTTLRRVNAERPITISVGKRALGGIVQNLHGLTRRQVEHVITDAVWEDRELSADDLGAILLRKRQVLDADGLLEFVEAPARLEDLGGLGRLKGWLRERERALSDEARAYGIEAPRGVLMLGVQGAGKSLCAKAIATAWRRPLLRLDPGVLYDRYIGESERRLREALRQAEAMAPAVLWIDEIEKAFASAAARSVDGGLSQRLFGTLLTWLQEHRAPVFVAATANDIEALPPELLRKGRFDEVFFVDLPGEEARAAILDIHLKRRGCGLPAAEVRALARACAGYSGAEIEQAVVSALHSAFARSGGAERPGRGDVERAISGSPPLSVTMAERVAGLREWARGRCVPAE